jgi:hypothetical protein
MTKTKEELRAKAEHSIVHGGVPGFLLYEEVGQVFADACSAKRRELYAQGKVKGPDYGQIAKPAEATKANQSAVPAVQTAPEPAKKKKRQSALRKTLDRYITGGEPKQAPASDGRNADGEYGDYRDLFALPLGEEPKWMIRQREENLRKKEAEEARKASLRQPEPEFIPSPEADEDAGFDG